MLNIFKAVAISDHLPTFFIKKKDKLKKTFSNFYGRSYVKYVKADFQRDVRSHQLWHDFWELEEDDPERLWDITLKIISEVADFHCPMRKMKFREDSPEWVTKEMVQEISHKDYLYKKANFFMKRRMK